MIEICPLQKSFSLHTIVHLINSGVFIFYSSVCTLPLFQPFLRWLLTRRDQTQYLQIITITSLIWMRREPRQPFAHQWPKRDSFLSFPNRLLPRRLRHPRRQPKPLSLQKGLPRLPASHWFRPRSPLSQPGGHQLPHASPSSPLRRHHQSRL